VRLPKLEVDEKNQLR